jgi:lipid-binding SYLF domain-containing protein
MVVVGGGAGVLRLRLTVTVVAAVAVVALLCAAVGLMAVGAWLTAPVLAVVAAHAVPVIVAFGLLACAVAACSVAAMALAAPSPVHVLPEALSWP